MRAFDISFSFFVLPGSSTEIRTEVWWRRRKNKEEEEGSEGERICYDFERAENEDLSFCSWTTTPISAMATTPMIHSSTMATSTTRLSQKMLQLPMADFTSTADRSNLKLENQPTRTQISRPSFRRGKRRPRRESTSKRTERNSRRRRRQRNQINHQPHRQRYRRQRRELRLNNE